MVISGNVIMFIIMQVFVHGQDFSTIVDLLLSGR